VLLLVALASLAACGGEVAATPALSASGATASASGSLVATSSPAAAPSPAPTLTIDQMGNAYLACAKAYNAKAKKLDARLNSATTLKQAKAAIGDYSDLDGVFGACIRAVAWTPTFAATARSLVKAVSAEQVTELAMSKAKTNAQYQALVPTWNKQSLAAASTANLLRGDLGLPAVGG
jgi:hypothetical protein